MMRALVVLLALATLLGACGEDREVQAPPPAQEPTRQAISYFDRMVLLDHEGPKAQIHLESREDPIWFSSVRDAFAFSMLPEEPRDISAIYVTDMARAASWAEPGPGIWIEARDAHYVLGSAMRGGMGAEEPVPFGDRDAAVAFASEHGGEVVTFEDVPQDYVLGATAEPPMPQGDAAGSPAAHAPSGAH